MNPEQFRREGHRMVDLIADYWTTLPDRPVSRDLRAGDVAAMLPETAPETGESWDDIHADIERIILPGLLHWQHPGFFGYFPANASGPSVLGEMLSAGLGVQGMLWSTSPACTEVEIVVLDWLVAALGLPEAFLSTGDGGGVIQDSASSSTLVALLAARHRASGGSDLTHPVTDLTVYTSDQAHSSVEKAVRIAGLGSAALRIIPSDHTQAMSVPDLERTMAEDISRGQTPALVVATVGTTSSTAIDPVAAIADVARRHGAWIHVDAAYAGSAAIDPAHRWINDGVEGVDSYSFNPHKWMLTNFDCSALWVRDRAPLISALSILPEYLRNAATESGAVVDFRDWQVPLGRRFRALKLWFVVRHHGLAGLREHVNRHIEAGRWLADRVEESDRYELSAPAPLGLVCLRHTGGDTRSQEILEEVNRSRRFFLTHTRLDDRYVIRVAIGGTMTEQRHVEDLWSMLTDLGR